MQPKHQNIPLHRMGSHTSLGLELSYLEMTEGYTQAMLHSDKNRAHRDDYYLFLFTETDDSSFVLDFEEMHFAGRTLMYIRPGQVHFANSIKRARGWVLAIDPVLIEGEYKEIFEEQFTTQKTINPQPNVAKNIEEAARLLYAVTRSEPTPISKYIILNQANALIGFFAEQYANQEHAGQNKSRPAWISHRFKALLSQSFKTIKSPSEYARMLNYSLSHLNESVKNTTGFTVSHWIHHQIILEAKRLLYYTDLDVKEIAFRLGYDDHTYFSRLFSKTAGVSPSVFRSKFHE